MTIGPFLGGGDRLSQHSAWVLPCLTHSHPRVGRAKSEWSIRWVSATLLNFPTSRTLYVGLIASFLSMLINRIPLKPLVLCSSSHLWQEPANLRLALRPDKEGLYVMKDDSVMKTWHLAYHGILELISPGPGEQYNANTLIRSHSSYWADRDFKSYPFQACYGPQPILSTAFRFF